MVTKVITVSWRNFSPNIIRLISHRLYSPFYFNKLNNPTASLSGIPSVDSPIPKKKYVVNQGYELIYCKHDLRKGKEVIVYIDLCDIAFFEH